LVEGPFQNCLGFASLTSKFGPLTRLHDRQTRITLAAIFAAIAAFLIATVGAIYWIGNQTIDKGKEVSMRRSAVDQLNIVLSTLRMPKRDSGVIC
jgi:hypothetical protein